MKTESTNLILLVDDNPQNLQLLGEFLSESGYEIACALNGPQAIKFCNKTTPDLILLDIMMPELDGYEVCQQLKDLEDTRGIPIIFLTAKREEEDVVKGFEVGAVDYVLKPFNSRELLARVKTHIELKQAREEIKTLRGIIPVCSNCNKIRNDDGYWQKVDHYLKDHSEAKISHGLCPNCLQKLYGNEPWFDKVKKKL